MNEREITVEITYPGKVISVNHYLGRTRAGGVYVKQEAQAWKDELGWAIKEYHLEDWRLPLTITISGCFKDNRVPDLHNFFKVTCDAIEEVTGINDRYMKAITSDYTVDGSKEPMLFITIGEGVVAE